MLPIRMISAIISVCLDLALVAHLHSLSRGTCQCAREEKMFKVLHAMVIVATAASLLPLILWLPGPLTVLALLGLQVTTFALTARWFRGIVRKKCDCAKSWVVPAWLIWRGIPVALLAVLTLLAVALVIMVSMDKGVRSRKR